MWIMNNWRNLLACLFEILMVFLCVYSIFKEKLKFSMSMIGLILFDLIILTLIKLGVLTDLAICIIYILLFIYCVVAFKRKLLETVGCFVLSFIVIGLIQITASFLLIPVAKAFGESDILLLLINIVSFLLAIVFSRFLYIKREKFNLKIYSVRWAILIIICALCLGFMIVDSHLRGRVDQIYYLLFLVLCILACVNFIKTQEIKHKLEKERFELELQEIYGDTYKELLFEVRRKQHDFMNQLSAIYSMHLTANSLEDLVEKQRAYGNVLIEQCRYDKILTGCNNEILAGYLYYKCINYEQSEVIVECQIHVNDAQCQLSLHEVIEILGILLTNAFESVESNIEKRIGLVVQENVNNLMIVVSNISNTLTSQEIEKMFESGYSSKGNNRGIGLARVKQLVKDAKAELIVKNQERENKNWVSFEVVIPK